MLLLLLWHKGRKELLGRLDGWQQVIIGCCLVLFGSLLDITDNFPELDKFVVVGHTPVEAFLEKVVGYLGGFLFLFVGFWKWIPLAARLDSMQDRLTDREARFHAMVENSTDWIWEVDANGRYSYVSPRVYDLLGYSQLEVMGRSPFDFMPKDEADRIRAAFMEHVAAKRAFALLENVNIHKDGRLVVLETSGTPLLDREGHVVGYHGIDRDITQRKQTELALRESEARFRDLFESSPDPAWVMEGRRFVEGNPAAVGMFGYKSRADFLNLHPTQISPPAQPDGESSYNKAERMMQLAEERGIHRFEWLHQRTDGSEFFAEVTLAAFTLRGKPALYVTVRDISERKQAQAELEIYQQQLEARVKERTAELLVAKEAAEAASLAKRYFMANMSHEMRTPIHQAMGMATLVRRDALTPRQTERLDKLDAALGSLGDIIETILQLTNIESGKLSLACEPLDFRGLVDETVAGLHDCLDAKRLAMQIDVPPMGTVLVGDGAHLKTALFNYLSNAIRFTDGGSVTVRTTVVDENEHSAMVRFEVVDTGIGIAPEDQERIFSVFEQADNTTSRKYQGIGAGLAITRKIAHVMGGDAGCDSTPGAGSTFWFTARFPKAGAAVY
jgi:hypothetical protein